MKIKIYFTKYALFIDFVFFNNHCLFFNFGWFLGEQKTGLRLELLDPTIFDCNKKDILLTIFQIKLVKFIFGFYYQNWY
ncbi:MAG: hypothetical protein KatS3mg002_1088 [Candidatus Woesearchaeota archaeon]|nr:MAG: hypothetical protein KatS3mg002_1088 [Candidatus Woesearchaeota archaeon]